MRQMLFIILIIPCLSFGQRINDTAIRRPVIINYIPTPPFNQNIPKPFKEYTDSANMVLWMKYAVDSPSVNGYIPYFDATAKKIKWEAPTGGVTVKPNWIWMYISRNF